MLGARGDDRDRAGDRTLQSLREPPEDRCGIAGLGLLTQRGLVVMPREVVVQNMLGGPVRRYPFERLSDLVVTGEDLYVAGTPVVLATRFSNLSAEDWRAMELELRAAAREWDGEEEEDGAEEDDHEDDE